MNIVIGVSGGIAVYKACELVRLFKKNGHDVFVVMTKNACEFVLPLTFQTLSQNTVVVDMFEKIENWDVEHIELAKKADLFLIVPATANVIGKIANGIADDFLTTTVMATLAPVLICPAMNTNMYKNKIVKRNIQELVINGYYIIEPIDGELACGDVGRGKLADINDIYKKALSLLNKKNDFKDKKILITAGPTREAIDPVRYISNRSSGKMGYSIANASLQRGANVTIVSGPVNINQPTGAKVINVLTADQMYEKVLEQFEDFDIVILVAAVSDFKCRKESTQKIKKKDNDCGQISLNLEQNVDIAKKIGSVKTKQVLVGFCAETQNLIDNAKQKIISKNLDLIISNDVSLENSGFDSNFNTITIIDKFGNKEPLEKMTKEAVAHKILDSIQSFIFSNKK